MYSLALRHTRKLTFVAKNPETWVLYASVYDKTKDQLLRDLSQTESLDKIQMTLSL